MTPTSRKKQKQIAANNKRVAAIKEQCDRLTDKELIQLADEYKAEYF